MTNKLYKTIALALTAVTLSLPISTQALAASHNDGPKAPTKVEQRQDIKKPAATPKQEVKHNSPAPKHEVKHNSPAPKHEVKKPAPAPKHEVKKPAPAPKHQAKHTSSKSTKTEESHSDTGNLITGGIIGLVLGAIIANNI